MRSLFFFFILAAMWSSILRKVRAAPNKYKTILVRDFDTEDELDDEEEEEDNLLNQETVFQQGETRDFLRFLKAIKYDHRQCPEGKDGGAVEVKVSVVVSNVRSVSEITMDYAVEIFYRESWTDPRLQYKKEKFKNKTEISLHESYSNFLWHPDTFVPNALTSKNPRRQSVTHRSLLRLRQDGGILFSRRLSLVLSCAMDLTLFPFDTQLCKMGIESYGHTADLILYSWSTGGFKALRLQRVSLPDYHIEKAFVTSRMEKYATGEYSRLYVCFIFSRAAGFCFLQLIIPSTAVVITSWVCLWMENETSFQDMISIILTITFLLFSYNEVMPRVSYLKAMDIYLGVCFCIVFFSLIKLALLKYMQQQIRKNRSEDLPPIATPLIVNGDHNANKSGSLDEMATVRKIFYTNKCVQRCHWGTQVIFMLVFVSFCLFFYFAYPNIHQREDDADCDLSTAEFFAEVL